MLLERRPQGSSSTVDSGMPALSRKRRDLLKEGLETRVPSFWFSLGPHGRTQDELRRSVMSARALFGIGVDIVEARWSRVGGGENGTY